MLTLRPLSPTDGRELFDKLCVGGGELEILELVAGDPAEGLDVNGFRFTGKELAAEEAEVNGFFGVGVCEVFDEFTDGNFNAEFFADFAREAGLEGFAGFDFAAREFPEVGKMIVGAALGDKEFAVVKD